MYPSRCISSPQEGKKLSPRLFLIILCVIDMTIRKNRDLMLQHIFVFKQALRLIAAPVTSMAPLWCQCDFIILTSWDRHRHRRHSKLKWCKRIAFYRSMNCQPHIKCISRKCTQLHKSFGLVWFGLENWQYRPQI